MEQTIKYLKLLREKDLYTFHHSLRVSYYSELIGKELNYTKEEMEILKISALLHDIGKIYINDQILNKKGKLNKKEYEEIKKHSIYGYLLLKDKNYAQAILFHHERLDGKGYPFGIKNIPLNAQIIAIADSFDAMTSYRGYNIPVSFNHAFNELINNKGYNKILVKLLAYAYFKNNQKVKIKKELFL